LRRLLYTAGIIALVAVAIGVFLPSKVHVERRTVINAPVATVFALVADVRRMTEWLPWADPDLIGSPSFSGPRRGVGATIRWSDGKSASDIPPVTQTIIESVPFERVVNELNSGDGKTFSSAFTLEAVEGGTGVLWSFDADFRIDLVARYFRPVLVARIGRDYEDGLADLRSMAENLPQADFGDLAIKHMIIEPMEIAYLTTTSRPSAAAISEAIGDAYFNVLTFMRQNGLQEAGAPLSISRVFSGSQLVFDAAIPVRGVTESTPESGNRVKLGRTYGGAVIRVTHVGSYARLGLTHEMIAAYLAAYGIERTGDAWESYETDPTRTPEAGLLTYVYYPVGE
jgi:effector-binding domain-containing protein